MSNFGLYSSALAPPRETILIPIENLFSCLSIDEVGERMRLLLSCNALLYVHFLFKYTNELVFYLFLKTHSS